MCFVWSLPGETKHKMQRLKAGWKPESYPEICRKSLVQIHPAKQSHFSLNNQKTLFLAINTHEFLDYT